VGKKTLTMGPLEAPVEPNGMPGSAVALAAVVALVAGALIVFLLLRPRAVAANLRVSQVEAALSEAQAASNASIERLAGELTQERSRAIEAERNLAVEQANTRAQTTRLDEAQGAIERLKHEAEQALERASVAERNLAVERAKIEAMAAGTAAELKQTFADLAADALKNNSEAVIKIAKSELSQEITVSHAIISPVSTALNELQHALSDFKVQVTEDRVSVKERLESLSTISVALQQALGDSTTATADLRSALSNTAVRAKWGEISLRRIVEIAGMTEHCDFDEQVTIWSELGHGRPDMVITMPDDRRIPLDSKAPFENYRAAVSCTDPMEQRALMERSARDLRGYYVDLARRPYQQLPAFGGFVIMFVPYESLLAQAAAVDQTLLEDAASKHILISSPTLLLIYLQAIAHGWRIQRQEESAAKIAAQGERVFQRVQAFTEKYHSLGSTIRTLEKKYNDAVGTLRNVNVQADRLKQLGNYSGEIRKIEEITVSTREAELPVPGLTLALGADVVDFTIDDEKDTDLIIDESENDRDANAEE
jgi:DNA recombination protein RmuC